MHTELQRHTIGARMCSNCCRAAVVLGVCSYYLMVPLTLLPSAAYPSMLDAMSPRWMSAPQPLAAVLAPAQVAQTLTSLQRTVRDIACPYGRETPCNDLPALACLFQIGSKLASTSLSDL